MRDKNRLWIAHNSLKLEWKYFIFVWKWYSFCLHELNCPENLQDSITKSVFTQTTFDRIEGGPPIIDDLWRCINAQDRKCLPRVKFLTEKKYNQIKVLFLSRTRFFCQLRKIWTSSEFSLHIIKADELTVPNSTQEISRYLRNNFSEVSLFLLRASFRLRLFFPIQILTVCPLCDVHIFTCTKFTEGHSTSLGYLWHN